MGAHAWVRQETPPTVEAVTAALQQLENSTSPETASVRETYRRTLDFLKRTKEASAKAAKFQAEAAEAPALVTAVSNELDAPSAAIDVERLPNPTLEELTSRADKAQAALEAARATVAELESTAARRTARKASLPSEIAQATQALATAQETLAATPEDEGSAVRRNLLLAEVALHQAELQSLTAERDSYAARSELLPLRRDRAARDVSAAEQRYEAWRQRLGDFRERDGESAASEAKAQLDDVVRRFPALEPLALANQSLTVLRSGPSSIPRQLSSAEEALERSRILAEEIQARFRSAKRRIDLGGLSESAGFTLRRDFEWLPRESLLASSAKERAADLSAAELRLLDLEDQRALLSDTDAAARRFLSEANIDSPDALEQAANLLDAQRDSLDVVITELKELTATLYDHLAKGTEIETASTDYRGFIEQRILWVRSCPTGMLTSLAEAPVHAIEIGQSISEGKLGSEVLDIAKGRGLFVFLVLILVGALVAGRGFLQGKRDEMGKLVRSYKTDRYVYTVRALAQSLLLSLPAPLLAWLLAQLLSGSSLELARAAGSSLQETSFFWLVLSFLSALLADKSVGNVHFRWPQAKTTAVRAVLRWFTPVALIFGFVALTLHRQSVTEWSDSVGRLSFLIAMGSLAFALHNLLSQRSALWGSSLEEGEGLLTRTHRWWSIVAVGVPVAVSVLALSGYYYTALQLELHARYSLCLALGLVLINALLLRWLFITRRKLAVSQALEARAKKDKEREEEDGEANQPGLDTDQVDIPSVDAQTRQLFRSGITLATVLGLYLIWSAALPALQGLRRVQLLPHPAIVAASSQKDTADLALAPEVAQATEEVSVDPSAALGPELPATTDTEPSSTGGIPSVLTLADVVLAAILALLTSVAARNLPALLELALLQKLPLDGGSRYAVSTLLRYVIIIFGVSAVSGALGIGWSDIQWLAAALTFGLAFGLQEIFANFVSGIIILIERPVRVGDIVTVGTTEGRVTRLRMRATTILDWDRKEYLVPNKEFITSSVVNWTLSDPITRIIINVGIAYGSDTAKARSLLLKVATENSLVVASPGPTALFRRFGDSTLDFELRVFVENRDLWPQLIDQIHSQIDAAFRAADIEIAFPQRDLHIRTHSTSFLGPEESKPAGA
jgi:potassium efflux system protein